MQTLKLKKKRSYSNNTFIFFMLLPAVVSLLIFTYYPMVKGITMAFQSYSLFNLSNVKWIGLDNFKELFTPSPLNSFYRTLGNTLKWVVISLLFQFIMGFILAMLLKKGFRGMGLYKGVAFMPWAISGFVIGIMWRWMFNGTSGVINDVLMRIGLISEPMAFLADKATALNAVIFTNVWYGIPFFTMMIGAALQGVPLELYEAARVDGASSIKQFFSITLPFIKPVLTLTVLLRVIWIFNFPELIYSMTGGGPGGSTHIITSFMLDKINGLDYGMGSAVGVVVILMLTVYTIFYLSLTKFEDMGEM